MISFTIKLAAKKGHESLKPYGYIYGARISIDNPRAHSFNSIREASKRSTPRICQQGLQIEQTHAKLVYFSDFISQNSCASMILAHMPKFGSFTTENTLDAGADADAALSGEMLSV